MDRSISKYSISNTNTLKRKNPISLEDNVNNKISKLIEEDKL